LSVSTLCHTHRSASATLPAGLLQRTGADELMLTAMVYDIEDRIRSFELIAEKVAGGLTKPGQ
jgi:hypothetical protein